MTTTTRLSLDEFLAMPESEPAGEYLCGEVIRKPMPTNAHGTLQLYLGMLLFQFLARTKLGRVRTGWRCIFGPPGRERALVSDVAYASFQRVAPGDVRDHPYLRTAPDLAGEVVSPGQSAALFADKMHFYLLHGVRMVWVVDPQSETIRVFRLGEDTVTLTVGDTLDGGEVLPGFAVPVAEIMAQLQESA